MTGDALTVLRDKMNLFVPSGFRDEDGVWHDGPHQIEFIAALDAVEALVESMREITNTQQATSSGDVPDDQLEWQPISGHAARDIARAALARFDGETATPEDEDD